MKIAKLAVLVVLLLMIASGVFAQARRGQFELYAGAGFPLGLDAFKDYHKVGLSLNAQYVFFPSPSLGVPIFAGYERFSLDSGGINDLFAGLLQVEFANFGIDLLDADLDTDGSSSTIKFGVGLRPYLTKPEAPTQFFLFGTATMNLLREELERNGGTITFSDGGLPQTVTFTAQDLRDSGVDPKFKNDDEKFGLAGGAGIEIPAGESLNLIVQGLFNVIFTEGDSVTFLGVTAGLVF